MNSESIGEREEPTAHQVALKRREFLQAGITTRTWDRESVGYKIARRV